MLTFAYIGPGVGMGYPFDGALVFASGVAVGATLATLATLVFLWMRRGRLASAEDEAA